MTKIITNPMNKEKDVLIKIPVHLDHNDKWKSGELLIDGSIKVSGLAYHDSKESCLVCCNAFNDRVKAKSKLFKKIIKQLKRDGKKESEKAKKQKSKKESKKNKNSKSKSKSKNRKKN